MDLLKLIALDSEDLAVVSAHLQDSLIRVADIHWWPAEQRVVIGLFRFDWEAAQCSHQYHRRHTALRFERVRALKARNVLPAETDRMLNLLAVEFDASDDPGGAIRLICSDGVVLRLDVECLEAELADLGPVWDVPLCPNHPLDAVDPVESRPH